LLNNISFDGGVVNCLIEGVLGVCCEFFGGVIAKTEPVAATNPKSKKSFFIVKTLEKYSIKIIVQLRNLRKFNGVYKN
jgi:hypothetical protein